MAMSLASLPDEVLSRIILHLPLPQAASAICGLRVAGRATAASIGVDSAVWMDLLHLMDGRPASSLSPARRSTRLVMPTAEAVFIKAWHALITRNEAFHHAIACSGQDAHDLSVSGLRRAFTRWGPCLLIDRASPVYMATVLMEICRARGVREATLVSVVEYAIWTLGADPNARPGGDSCTPLIIAASRGLPRLAAYLLACGADPSPVGYGRFRLCGRAQSLAGRHSALAWSSRLLEAEVEAGVAAEHRRALSVSVSLLQRAVAARDDRERASVPCAQLAHNSGLAALTLGSPKAKVRWGKAASASRDELEDPEGAEGGDEGGGTATDTAASAAWGACATPRERATAFVRDAERRHAAAACRLRTDPVEK